MSSRVIIGLVLAATVVVVGILVLGRPRAIPKLPPMVAHCASGVAGMGLCSEWSVEAEAEKSLCTKAEGTWSTGPCPADVSSAGGTCVIVKPERTGALHYASGWKGRSQSHCQKRNGIFNTNP